MVFFQQPPIPVALGAWGTLLLGLVVAAQTVMAFYSWRKSGALNIVKEELTAYKARAERLEGEVKAATQLLTELRLDEKIAAGNSTA